MCLTILYFLLQSNCAFKYIGCSTTDYLNNLFVSIFMNSIPHLELIIGTMYSGKSTELIRRVKRYQIAGLKCQLFKPAIDNRYDLEHVTSHDELRQEAKYVENVEEIEKEILAETRVIGIDEVQFMESKVVDFCNYQANKGRIVVAAGLLKDFLDNPFRFKDKTKTMADLVPLADHITYLKSICTYKDNGSICGHEATRVQRYVDNQVAPKNSPLVQVGGKESYSPRCREHFVFYS